MPQETHTISLRQLTRGLLLLALGGSLAQARVTIAQRPLFGQFATIQDGVNAALEILNGAGGEFYVPPGQAIVALHGAIIDLLLGAERKISAIRITSDDVPYPIMITGQPGDHVFLLIARKPAFVVEKPLNGTWMVPSPFLSTTMAMGTIGAGGPLVIDHTFDLPDGTVLARLYWLQAICVDTNGRATLTEPAHVLPLE